MDDRYLKNMINRLIKQADDMGLWHGEGAMRNRNLRWHRLHQSPNEAPNEEVRRLNQYNLHGLPPMAVKVYQDQMKRFSESYENFVRNSKTGKPIADFNTMIFTVYAEDRLLNEQVEQALQSRPDLQQTSQFVNDMAVKLPSPNPKDPSKDIGSDFWFSHFGYAYQAARPNDVERMPRAVAFGIYPFVPGSHDSMPHGRIVIGRTDDGYGLFLSTADGQMLPLYQGQTDEGFKKYFNNMLYNKSSIYAPQGPDGPVEQAWNPKVSPASLQRLFSDDPARARRVEDAKRKFEDRNNIWTFGLAEDGTLTMFKVDGRGTSRVKSQERPLSQEQIRSLATPVIFEKEWTAISERGMVGEGGVTQGPYQISQQLRQELMDPNNPIGVPKLQEYRRFCEQARGGDLHTPIEGYKIITVGPIFSNPNTKEEGKTDTTAPMANPVHQVNPQSMGESLEVVRGLKWLLLANEIQEPRLLAQGRNRLFPSKGAGGGGIHEEYYPTAKLAIASMISKYLASSMEDGMTKRIISEGAASVDAADRALRNALSVMPATQGQQTTSPQQNPIPTQQPQTNMPINSGIVGPYMSPTNQQGQSFASLKQLIKRHVNG